MRRAPGTPAEKLAQLHEAVRSEDWLETHVTQVVKRLKAEGKITADPVPGKTPARSFTIKAKPILRFVAL
jgi:hypothetical protein